MAKPKAIIKKCVGEAHRNPHIDNCMVCMPFWGTYPMCPTDERKLTETGYCRVCRKHFDISDRRSVDNDAAHIGTDIPVGYFDEVVELPDGSLRIIDRR